MIRTAVPLMAILWSFIVLFGALAAGAFTTGCSSVPDSMHACKVFCSDGKTSIYKDADIECGCR